MKRFFSMTNTFWIVNQYAVPPYLSGGTRHYEIAKRLARLGYDITIFTSNFDHLQKQHLLNPPKIVNGVKFDWIYTAPYSENGIGRIVSMIGFCFSLIFSFLKKEKPDYIFASSPHLFGAFFALIYAKLRKIPFCLEIRDVWPQSLIEVAKVNENSLLIKLMERIESYLYVNSDKIVTLLENSVDHIVSKGAARNNIMVIPNGPSLSEDFKEWDLSLDPENFYVMYAGSHGVANALDSILDFAALLMNEKWADKVRVVFVGDGTEKARLSSRLALEKISNVIFLDPVPKENMSFVLEKADVLIATLLDSPLYEKGISLNKIYDYLYAAKPIIFGAKSFNNPVLEANAGIVVPPQNAREMLTALQKFYFLSSEERKEFGDRGKKYVVDHFGFDAKVKDLIRHLGIVRS
jgi:Glycosyl transferase 4-like domain/Glycosyl transferases group 1